jgi:spore photoproduct lyase
MSFSSCSVDSTGFGTLYVDRRLAGPPALAEARERLPGLECRFVASAGEIPAEARNQRTLYLSRPRGRTVSRCPGSPGQLCCNYLTVDLYLGCTLGCAYCIMRSYLNFSPVTVYLDPDPTLARLEAIARSNSDRIVRVGTGEVGDSLLLDPVFRLSERFIRRLASYPNMFLELKTKTNHVDHLLSIEPKGNAVIGFSVNPPEMVQAWEPGAASLEQRLEAAQRAIEAGYRVSFHFDPIFLKRPTGAEALGDYRSLARRIAGLPADRVAWISLGGLRYTPTLKERIGEVPFLYEEFVPGRDGKYRYPQKVRTRLYSALLAELRALARVPVYLCMESPAAWRLSFGRLPAQIPEIRDIFKKAKRVPPGPG